MIFVTQNNRTIGRETVNSTVLIEGHSLRKRKESHSFCWDTGHRILDSGHVEDLLVGTSY